MSQSLTRLIYVMCACASVPACYDSLEAMALQLCRSAPDLQSGTSLKTNDALRTPSSNALSHWKTAVNDLTFMWPMTSSTTHTPNRKNVEALSDFG